ncbi:MAG: hypothetical protein Q7O66_07555 [Dehalococcoidia bacterium]|nr:hypothetical protein [Dehalococcoidia bacterium]
MKLTWIVAARLLAVLTILLAVVAASVGPNPITTSATPHQAMERTIPFTDVNPLGANFFLDREVETWKKEITLKMAKDAGIGWVKQMFAWEEIEPSKDRFWDERYRKSTWDKFDEAVSLSEKYGLRIIARLDRPPAWARADNSESTSPPKDFNDYGNFVYNIVNRYKGRIQYYQIWNEPNLGSEWGKNTPSASQYVELLKIAYKRAKEADPNVVILAAPLAATLEEGPANISDLTFLGAMYKAGARDYFDIMSANVYGFDKPPSDPPNPKVLNFSRVTLLRNVMVENGDSDKAVWFNEFGWNASPEDFPKQRLFWGRVSEQQQADYTFEAINLARTWEWAGVINIWYFRQVGDISPVDHSEYYFRVVDINFTPRPVYHVLQNISIGLKIAPPGTHQESSPAAELSGRWKIVQDPRLAGKAAITAESPGNSIAFTFFGTEVALLAKTDRFSGKLYVEVDGAPSPSLSWDERNKTTVSMNTPDDHWQVKVPLVKGLPPAKHTLVLTLTEPGGTTSQGQGVTIDGFIVDAEPYNYWNFYAKIALALMGLAGFFATFQMRRR